MDKKLHIYHGTPGSGKSSDAKMLVGELEATEDQAVEYCSADRFWSYEGGEHDFNPKLLPQAHALCQKSVFHAMLREIHHVIVDNTAVCYNEWVIYEHFAGLLGYEIVHHTFKPKDNVQVLEWAMRNTHGVPISVCFQMWERWEDPK